MLYNKSKFDMWQPALFDGQFHWDFLLPAWMPTPIQPSDVDAQMTVMEDGTTSGQAHDIDAKIERRGHRLLFETKDNGGKIDKGPIITLTNEWRIGATIIFVDGKTAKDVNGFAVFYEGKYSGEDIPARPKITQGDAFDLIYLCRKWFLWAQKKTIPCRNDWDNQLWTWDYERGLPWVEWCRDRIRDGNKSQTDNP